MTKATIPVFETEIPRAAAFHHAALAGVLFDDVRARGATRLALEYRDVVSELKETNG